MALTSEELIRRIEEAGDAAAIRQFLEGRRAELSSELIGELKVHSDSVAGVDPGRAVRIADALLHTARLLRDEAGQALGLWAKANALRRLGRYRLSLRWYEHAANRFRRQGLEAEAARTLIGKVDALMYLGEYDAALACAASARSTFRRGADHLQLAKIEANTGNLHHRLDRCHDALRHYNRARRLLARLNEHGLLAQVDSNRANVLVLLNRFREARRVYERVRSYYAGQGGGSAVGIVDINLGFLEHAQGRYQQALTHLTSAREVLEQAGLDHLAASAALDLSDVYLALNLYAEASRLCNSAKATFDRLGMRYEGARALTNKATAEAQLGRSSLAMSLLGEAERLFREERNEAWVATVDLHRSVLLLQASGDNVVVDEALRLCRQAAAVFERLALPAKQGYAHLVHGRILEIQGELDEAQQHYREARDTATRLRLPWLAYQGYHAEARLAERTDPALANQYYQHAVDELESMWNDLQPEDLRTSFVSNRLQVYEDFVLHLLEGGEADASSAFHVVERAKSRALIDLLAGRLDVRARTAEDGGLARRIGALRAELNWFYNRLAAGETSPDQRNPRLAAEITDAIRSRESELGELFQRAQLQRTEFTSLQQVEACAAEEVQALLPDDTAVLEYYVTGDEILSFVVTREQVRAVRGVSHRQRITSLTDRLRFQLGRFSYGPAFVSTYLRQLCDGADEVLSELYEELVEPLRARVAGRRLIVVPHGPLHYLPFHAFRGPRGYLIEEHEISYSPSASVLRFCFEKPVRRPTRAVVVGVADERLPNVRREVEDVASVFPSAVVLTDQDATQAAIASHARHADILHVASHGVFSADNPMFSRIKLADSWLSAHDIYNLRLNASLVTLSACETGVNQVAAGDELIGLARGFFYAGTSSLLLSLWPVDDASTARLMSAFYTRLLEGQPKASALREAQMALMDEFQHPYYWAPFVLLGRGDW